jgi:hypothetical protein
MENGETEQTDRKVSDINDFGRPALPLGDQAQIRMSEKDSRFEGRR